MNTNPAAMSDNLLEQTLVAANDAYRNTGTSVMHDTEYDAHIAELTRRNPAHPFLTTVEPEGDFGLSKVTHGIPMLSTTKAYTNDDLSRWVRRIEAAAVELGLSIPVPIKINAKLDGMAGRLENGVLASRGDGTNGNNITHMIPKGLKVIGSGDGELVMEQAYFDDNLSEEFKHPRNVVTGAVGADTPRPAANQALRDQAIHFVSYDTLEPVYTDTASLVANLPAIRDQIIGGCLYPTDGLVLVVEGMELRSLLGSTSHSHTWMLASKTAGETADALATGILWSLGRTGRCTPVVQIESVLLSGAVISNISGHNAGTLEAMRIAPGATVTITRAGSVIPALVACQPTAAGAELPTNCPVCDSNLTRQKDFLICGNTECKGRRQARVNHFFNIIGTIDLFGPVACERLVAAGVRTVREIFAKTPAEFEAMGFGPGQALNLFAELTNARTRPVEDFRVLAAMGVSHLGRGDSKKLLKIVALKDIPSLTSADIGRVQGFGDLTANSIAAALPSIADDLLFLERTLKGIIATPTKRDAPTDTPISGKFVVFTGTMVQGSRSDMVKNAEALGATSQSSVNKKTTYLVAGENVGESKLTKAKQLGTTILSESDYLALIGAGA
jgi:DNA ligase (NAD+)